jgi:peptidoglycan hydrolase CwlO-like protein
MSYENSPSTKSPQPQGGQKDSRKLIYGALIVLLLGTWGYIIYDKSKSKEEFTQLQTQFTNVDSARTAIQGEYDDALRRMDSLTGSNTKLQGSLAERQTEIEKLKSQIKSELRQKNGDLSKAKSLINELNGKINDLLAEVERLKGENQQLTASNQQLTVERDTLNSQKQVLQQNLTTSETEKEHLNDVGSTLHASNINITAIDVKGSGKEKSTTTAKRADLLRISFDLDENRIASTGSKELYVCITGPDGKPISIPAYGSGTFQTREDGEKVYTNKVNVQYEQGKRTPVSFDWKQDGRYQTGDYKIEIYQNGFKIGQGTKTLKKGGLFS